MPRLLGGPTIIMPVIIIIYIKSLTLFFGFVQICHCSSFSRVQNLYILILLPYCLVSVLLDQIHFATSLHDLHHYIVLEGDARVKKI